MSELKIPKNWNSKPIYEITESHAGGTPRTGVNEYWDGGTIPWIRSGKLKDTIINSSDVFITEKGLKNSSAKLYPPQTVLVAITGATTGKTGLLKIEACGTQNVFGILPCDEILPEYLWYYMRYYYKQLFAKSIGGAQGHVNGTIIKNTIINYPKNKEIQKKIVRKLDYVLGQLEEKKKIILELQTSKIKHIKILSDKTIGNIISKLMHLDSSPDSWDVQNIENICKDIQPGFAEGKKNVKDGVIHLRMNNIGTNFDLNFDLIRTIETNKDKLEKYQLKQGDVIFNNTNSSKLVGKSAIFNDSKVCLYSNHLTRLRVKKELVLPEWILFYFRARWLNGDFERMCNKWINQAAVNNNKIKNLEIPVPNIETQKKIVESLSNVSKNIEVIRIISESILKQEKINLTHFENLSSKILDSAFSGKLVN